MIDNSPFPQGWPANSELLLAEIAELRRQNEMLARGIADPGLHSRMAAIVESSDDAIVSKTLNGVILSWNSGARRIFGWEPEEVIGKAINIIIPPDRQEEEPHILSRIQRGERVDHFETVRMRKDGQLIDVSVTISPIRDAQGTIIGASKIARDVTIQKKIQRELEVAKNEAERANRAKDHFLSVLSHELRTPLTPVLAEMSYLEEMADIPDSVRTSIAMIRRNVETEARLVDDLLDLTRISRGKLQLDFEVVDINEAMRAVVGMLQSQIDEKQLELAVGLRARQHHVWADPGRLQQVLLNLLSNAVKFTPNGGQIALRTANDDDKGDTLRIEISDSGIGIEREMMPRIFGAFEQSDYTRRFGGLGLGLTIARTLLEMHQGTIVAASEGRDRGAVFTVELPVTQRQPVQHVPGGDASAAPKLSGFRVLLVEDHTDTRTAMSHLLRAIGCSVQTAGSVKEAVDLAESAEFDLLISDIGLPDGSGTDIMTRLRNRNIRGIALSGFGQEEDVKRSRAAGFDAHITKPINFQALRETVSRYAEGK